MVFFVSWDFLGHLIRPNCESIEHDHDVGQELENVVENEFHFYHAALLGVAIHLKASLNRYHGNNIDDDLGRQPGYQNTQGLEGESVVIERERLHVRVGVLALDPEVYRYCAENSENFHQIKSLSREKILPVDIVNERSY